MTAEEILNALVEKRAQMMSDPSFTMGNVFGMNEAVDLVARGLDIPVPKDNQ